MNKKRNYIIATGFKMFFLASLLPAASIITDSDPPFEKDSSVTLSIDGTPDVPDAEGSCCEEKPEKEWSKNGNPTYSWSGDASGSNESSTLDTTLSDPAQKDQKSVTLTITQNWVCPGGTETTTTSVDLSGGPWEVWPVCGGEIYDSDNHCCVDDEIVIKGSPTPQYPRWTGGTTFLIADKSFTGSAFVAGEISGTYFTRVVSGLATNRTVQSQINEHDFVESGECGQGIAQSGNSYQADSGSLTFEASYVGVDISTTYSWSSVKVTPFKGTQPIPNVWQYGTVWEERRRPNGAHISGEVKLLNWPSGSLASGPNPFGPIIEIYGTSSFERVGFISDVNDSVQCCGGYQGI